MYQKDGITTTKIIVDIMGSLTQETLERTREKYLEGSSY